MVFVGAVEIPHPTQVPGRESLNLRMIGSDVLGCHNRSTLFAAAAYDLSNLTVQLHLRQFLSHYFIDDSVHLAVIDVLSYVHDSHSFCQKWEHPVSDAPIIYILNPYPSLCYSHDRIILCSRSQDDDSESGPDPAHPRFSPVYRIRCLSHMFFVAAHLRHTFHCEAAC